MSNDNKSNSNPFNSNSDNEDDESLFDGKTLVAVQPSHRESAPVTPPRAPAAPKIPTHILESMPPFPAKPQTNVAAEEDEDDGFENATQVMPRQSQKQNLVRVEPEVAKLAAAEEALEENFAANTVVQTRRSVGSPKRLMDEDDDAPVVPPVAQAVVPKIARPAAAHVVSPEMESANSDFNISIPEDEAHHVYHEATEDVDHVEHTQIDTSSPVEETMSEPDHSMPGIESTYPGVSMHKADLYEEVVPARSNPVAQLVAKVKTHLADRARRKEMDSVAQEAEYLRKENAKARGNKANGEVASVSPVLSGSVPGSVSVAEKLKAIPKAAWVAVVVVIVGIAVVKKMTSTSGEIQEASKSPVDQPHDQNPQVAKQVQSSTEAVLAQFDESYNRTQVQIRRDY